ncbi:molybdate transport system permease protein [Clostridium pascui]|uniref:molybdate ABC transporter permease subunit n=1 Tax=Clostridium pascui TaxID=46609 RepID=UPI001958A33A|nr:molybdate ABC transporter permease subunit [Clostridium pascui]MBM7869998.1 molybdate transport system permease protein [Clostridium pascui]
MGNAIILSLKISIISTTIVLILSLIVLKLLWKNNTLMKDFIETILSLPLVLPPSVIGYILLIVLSKNSALGKLLYESFNLQIIFTTSAGVIAAVIVSFPLMYQSVKSSITSIDKSYIEAARTMGASEFQVFFHIMIPMCWSGLISGIILSFCRSLGEFGATLMVMGNIAGKTQTIPLAIYFSVESGNTNYANNLVFIVILLSLSLNLILNLYLKKKCS